MIDRLPVTKAVESLIEQVTGRPVGIAVAPTNEALRDRAEFPYIVLEPRSGSGFSGPPFGDMYGDVGYGYQVTSIGDRQDLTEAVADRVRFALLGRNKTGFVHPLEIPGVVVMMREPLGPPGRMQREGKIYNVVDSFLLRLTSADE